MHIDFITLYNTGRKTARSGAGGLDILAFFISVHFKNCMCRMSSFLCQNV